MNKAPFKFDRLESNIFLREAPVNRPPKRLIPERRGQRFVPHGTDSVGTIVSDPRRNRKTVQFRYDHDPDTLHEMAAHEFNDRFARLVGQRRHRAERIPTVVSEQARRVGAMAARMIAGKAAA